MLNPSVGLTLSTSSPFIRFRIVVFPALSRPLYDLERKRMSKNEEQGLFRRTKGTA
jgi:hypothetical protein